MKEIPNQDDYTSINDLEVYIWNKDFKSAEACIISLIDSQSKGKINLTVAPFDRELSESDSDIESYQLIEKLATTLTHLFVSPDYIPSDTFFNIMCSKRDYLTNVFAASSYHSTDHILQANGLIGKQDYSKLDLQRLMLVYTIESSIQLPWSGLASFLPEATASLFNGLLSNLGIQLSHRAAANIQSLLNVVETFPVLNSKDLKALSPLIRSYFNCSFLPYDNKYALKQYVNKSLLNFLSNNLDSAITSSLSRVKKSISPTIPNSEIKVLFIHEHYRKDHAMYRCWHNMFCSISKEYKTVAIGQNLDDFAAKDFCESEQIKDLWDINQIVNQVLAYEPDVIIYPSIGMSPYSPLLALMRLAPIQIACGGHPSSSYSKEVDFYLWEDNVSENVMNNILIEQFLPYKSQFSPVTLVDIEKKGFTLDKDKTHIAINGVIQKVSNDLLKACNVIAQSVSQPVEFHFFMASPIQDLEYFAAKSIIRRLLPNSHVHPYGNYSNYMNTLSQCRFAIGTVPFGGSNSNIDLLRLAVPKLFVTDESDLPGLTDAQLWQSFEVLDGECQSLQELVERAKQWLVDDTLLEEIKLKMRSKRITELLHECETNQATDERLLPALAYAINTKVSN